MESMEDIDYRIAFEAQMQEIMEHTAMEFSRLIMNCCGKPIAECDCDVRSSIIQPSISTEPQPSTSKAPQPSIYSELQSRAKPDEERVYIPETGVYISKDIISEAHVDVTHLPSTSSAPQPEFIPESQQDTQNITGSTCSLEDFIARKHAMQLFSNENSLSRLFTGFFYEDVVAEFIRFMLYIEKQPEPGKSQLATLVFPITVHLYSLMMEEDDFGLGGARLFLRGRANIFRHKRSYQIFMDALSKFKDFKELRKDSRFRDFIKRKFVVKISRDVFRGLQAFLVKSKSRRKDSLLLYVLSFYVDFVDSDLYHCPAEDDVTEEGESSDKNAEMEVNVGGEIKVHDGGEIEVNDGGEIEVNDGGEIEVNDGGEIELNDMDPELKDINIIKIFINPQNYQQSFVTYDLDNEELVQVDDVTEYLSLTPRKKKPEPPKRRPPRRSRRGRTHFTVRKSPKRAPRIKLKIQIPVKEKKMFEMPDPNLRSVFSVDFNCTLTQIAFALGDNFIYTLAIVVPGNADWKHVNFNEDTMIHLYNLKLYDGDLKYTCVPESGKIYVVKYLPEKPSQLLVACTLKVILFDTEQCTTLSEYSVDTHHIYDIDIDQMGIHFACASENSLAFVYKFSNAFRVSMLTGHECAVTAVKFHPNGIYVATGSDDCTVRLFEVPSGQCVRLFWGLVLPITEIDFSYDGSLIAAGDTTGMVKIWDIKDCVEKSKMAWRISEENMNVIESLCFHEKTFVIAASNQKNEIRFWDIRNPLHKQTIRCVNDILKLRRLKDQAWVLILMPNVSEAKKEFAKKEAARREKY